MGCVTEATGFQTSIARLGQPGEFSAYEQTRPQISNITSSRNGTDYPYPRTVKLPLPIPTLFPSHPQLSLGQVSTASGFLQEPTQSRVKEHSEQSRMLPISYRDTESEILTEIQTMVALEVLRSRFSSFDASPNARCPSSDRKIHIANSLISKLELPEDYFIVGKFYRAIDAGIEDHTRRIKDFFLNEGSRLTLHINLMQDWCTRGSILKKIIPARSPQKPYQITHATPATNVLKDSSGMLSFRILSRSPIS